VVAEAVEFARASDWPDPATAAAHVFAPAGPPASGAADAGTRKRTYAQATLEALAAAMERDERIVVLGEGIGPRGGNFGTTTGLWQRFGAARLRDTPICERGFVGLACGAAMAGARVVVDFMFVDFMLDAWGELVNQIAKMQYMSSGRLKMPVVLRGCIGIGHSAATHHSGSYYSLLAHLPGLRVVVPATPYDAKGLLSAALAGNDPVVFLEHRELLGLQGPVPEEDYRLPLGKARVARAGRDVTIVGLAQMLHRALAAAEALAGEGIEAEVIDPRCVAPLDAATILESVDRTGRLLVVDEAFGPFGLGAEIAAQVVEAGFDSLDAPIRRLHGVQAPTPYSPALERRMVPDAAAIGAAVRDLLRE
jgi:2-oxoisovalerate dehydrogenase E1 component